MSSGSHRKQARRPSGEILMILILAVLLIALAVGAVTANLVHRGGSVSRHHAAAARQLPAPLPPSFPAPLPTVTVMRKPLPAGGDLWSMAREYCGTGTDWPALQRANHITSLTSLQPGEMITIDC